MGNKTNWIIHYVFDDITMPYGINVHTHGMVFYNHLEFQIVLGIKPELATQLLNDIGYKVSQGEVYKEGIYDGLIGNGFKVMLKMVQDDNGKDILRYILPDENGLFPTDKDCDEMYKKQIS